MSCTIKITLGIALLSGIVHSATAATAIRNADFLASLGVNTHLNYTDGTYADYAKVIADLDYLGVHKLRDWAPNPKGGTSYRNYVMALRAAAAAGNHFDFLTGADQPIATSLAQIDAIAAAHPGSVIAVEGPNETNNWPVKYNGLNGRSASLSFQRDLYAAVHADHNLPGAAVYYYTGLDVAWTIANLADYANTHPYPYHGTQPSARIDSDFIRFFRMPPPYPKVITETGYFNVPTASNGVDDATQAKNTLNLYLDAFNQGVSATYLYQLVSAYPRNDDDTQYGLFRRRHTPKPAATAIHNLTTILADTGRSGLRPGQLAYSVSGLPATGKTMLLQKSSGVFDLIVWAEPQNWDDLTHAPIKVTPTSVTVDLGAAYRTVAVYDPTASAAPRQTLSNVASARIDVADHPLIVETSAKPETVYLRVRRANSRFTPARSRPVSDAALRGSGGALGRTNSSVRSS